MFFGKKILILGANHETIPLIQAAKDMGLYVYVTDNNPSAPAKEYADEALNIDGLDVESLADFVSQNAVDGVLVGVADRLIDPYRLVCEKTDRPCYASQLQCEVLTDKGKFNEWCKTYGIKTIPSYTYDAIIARANGDALEHPVLVKPVDANSGKGMSVVRTVRALKESVDRAMEMSATKQILLERYMECDDVLLYYTFLNGTCYLSAIGDRYTNRSQGSLAPVCTSALYPSKYLESYKTKHHPDFLRLFEALEMKNGVLLISAFIEGDELFVYDPGFRFQGEGTNHHLKNVTHVDQYGMLIEHALTGQVADCELSGNDPNFGGKVVATWWFLLGEGNIGQVEGMSHVHAHPLVHQVIQRLDVGDRVDSTMIGTEAQVFARIFISADTQVDLECAITDICEAVNVKDDSGQEMLLPNQIHGMNNR